MHKINKLNILISIVYLCVFILIVGCCLFSENIEYMCKKYLLLPNYINLAIGLACIIIFFAIYKLSSIIIRKLKNTKYIKYEKEIKNTYTVKELENTYAAKGSEDTYAAKELENTYIAKELENTYAAKGSEDTYAAKELENTYTAKELEKIKSEKYIQKQAKIKNILSKKSIKYISQFLIVIGAAFILFLFSRNYLFKTGWDPGFQIIPNAEKLANHNKSRIDYIYYLTYPNNILITVVYAVLYKIANVTHISGGYSWCVLLNCFSYSLTGLIFYKLLKRLVENKKVRALSMLVWVIFIFLSPWVIIPYSDSLGIGILAVCIYLYAMSLKTSNKRETVLLIALGILSAIAYKIKPQILIFEIGVVVVEVLNLLVDWSFAKNQIKRIAKIVIPFVLMMGIILISPLNQKSDKTFGIAHFLMMGLNENTCGTYSDDDVNYSSSFESAEERKLANIEKIKERINDLGFVGMIKHLHTKLLVNYNDGTFAWGVEGGFFLESCDTGNSTLREFFEKIYKNGEYTNYFTLAMQIIWLTILFLNIFVIMAQIKQNETRGESIETINQKKNVKNKDKTELIKVLQISILGLTLFELLFEARARYLFSYSTVYVLLAAVGLEVLLAQIQKYKKKIFNRKLLHE